MSQLGPGSCRGQSLSPFSFSAIYCVLIGVQAKVCVAVGPQAILCGEKPHYEAMLKHAHRRLPAHFAPLAHYRSSTKFVHDT